MKKRVCLDSTNERRRRKMKKLAFRIGFIAFALSLGLGIPGQASAADGGCDGRTMIHRKIKAGDTLSAIALDEYGNGTHQYYERIASASKVSDPDTVYAGNWLVVPCLAQRSENNIQ